MTNQTKRRLRVVGKVLGTLGIVAGMAMGFSWYGESDGLFGEADADIVTSAFAPKTDQQRFVDSLREYGFSEPRMYDYDGNTVFFSTKTTRKSPLHASRELQEIFHKNGVNDKVYNQSPKLTLPDDEKGNPQHFHRVMDAYRHLNSGQIVPMEWSRSKVSMGGIEMRGDPEAMDILNKFASGERILDDVKRIRYIDAFRESPTDDTSMTATWSDGNLNFNKFASDSSIDPVVPACPGCKRIRRFGGSGEESPYVENVFESNRAPRELRAFYRRALENRGWELSKATALIQEMEAKGFKKPKHAQFDAYARGGIFLHVLSYRDRQTGTTRVHVMRGP